MTKTSRVQIVLAVIAAAGAMLAAMIGNWDKLFSSSASSQKQPTPTQTSSGASSPNVANVQGDVSINISNPKSQLDFPSFDDNLTPLPGWRRNPEQGEEFNEFMLTHGEETVYLSVYLTEEMIKELLQNDIFTVQNNIDEFGMGGNEYLLHRPAEMPKNFEFDPKSGRLAGYFKVWGINGPRQGYMSVNLRPVKGE